MLKECFIKATTYKALEDVTGVDNEVKEFLENKSVLLPTVAFVVSTNEFRVGDKIGQGHLRDILISQQTKPSVQVCR